MKTNHIRSAKALVSWVPAAKGGRKRAPAGPMYSTVARFADDLNWPAEAWSLVVRKIRDYGGGRFWFAKVEFLVDDAPHGLLKPGARFDLYEGRKFVATGLVRGAQAKPPQKTRALQAVLLS
ncbi:MAG: hypothetical protein ABIP55_07300 [Tepidisphaeraceae bacterium]